MLILSRRRSGPKTKKMSQDHKDPGFGFPFWPTKNIPRWFLPGREQEARLAWGLSFLWVGRRQTLFPNQVVPLNFFLILDTPGKELSILYCWEKVILLVKKGSKYSLCEDSSVPPSQIGKITPNKGPLSMIFEGRNHQEHFSK